MPTLQPGSTSQAFDVDIGQTVSVTPGSGGTMLVEYTTNSETDIRNGSATWQAWTAGTVSSATSDVAMFPLFARVTAYTAPGSYELSGSGLRAVPNQYLAWKSDVVSARDPVSAAAVVGAAIGTRNEDALGRPVTVSRTKGVDVFSYGTDGKVKRQISAGRNYKLAAAQVLVDLSDPATVALSTLSLTGSTAVIGASAFQREGLSAGMRAVTGTSANDRATVTVASIPSLPAMTEDDLVLIPIYIEQCNTGDQIIVFFSPDNMASTSVSSTLGISPQKLGWNYIPVPTSRITGTAAIAAAHNSVRLQVKHVNAGGVATIVTVYGAWLNPRQVPRLMLTFDDGFLSQYTEAFAYMEPRGLVGNISVIAQTVGETAGGLDAFDYCSLAQLQEMHAAGWGMLTHGYYPHNGAPLSSNETAIAADIRANKQYLLDTGMTGNELHYVLPAGQNVQTGNATRNALISNGMLTARGVWNELIVTSEFGVDNPYQRFSLQAGATTGLSNLQAAIAAAILTGGTQELYFHRIVSSVVDGGNEISIADFQALIDGIVTARDAGTIDVVTVQQWYAGIDV